MSGAFFNPEDHTLAVFVDDEKDVSVAKRDGSIVVEFRNLTEGIEIFHDDDRLWRPA